MSQLSAVIVTTEDLSITVKTGCITKENVDVVVNCTSPVLLLDTGSLSRAILLAAGDVIQEECNQISPNGIWPGQIVRTSAGRMPARYIFHGTLPTGLKETGYAALCALLRCCLRKGDKDKVSSMAIPAVGTGNVGASHTDVAKVMYEEIRRFSEDNPHTTLRDIRIVLSDSAMYTDFSRCFRTSGAYIPLEAFSKWPGVEQYSGSIGDQAPHDKIDEDICIVIKKGEKERKERKKAEVSVDCFGGTDPSGTVKSAALSKEGEDLSEAGAAGASSASYHTQNFSDLLYDLNNLLRSSPALIEAHTGLHSTTAVSPTQIMSETLVPSSRGTLKTPATFAEVTKNTPALITPKIRVPCPPKCPKTSVSYRNVIPKTTAPSTQVTPKTPEPSTQVTSNTTVLSTGVIPKTALSSTQIISNTPVPPTQVIPKATASSTRLTPKTPAPSTQGPPKTAVPSTQVTPTSSTQVIPPMTPIPPTRVTPKIAVPSTPSTPKTPEPSTRAISGRPDAQTPHEVVYLTTKTEEDICIMIKKGDISEAKTDAVVNVTTTGSRLNYGAISSSILEAAGDTIQLECQEIAPDGLDYNDILITSGGELHCEYIFHVAVPEWQENKGKGDLQGVTTDALYNASDKGLASLAIPSVGTDLMSRYDHSFAARCMFDAIDEFSAVNPTISLKRIEIFALDAKVAQVFVDCFGTRNPSSAVRAVSLSGNSETLCEPDAAPSTELAPETTAPNSEVFPKTTPSTQLTPETTATSSQLTAQTTAPNTEVSPQRITPSTQLTPKTTAPNTGVTPKTTPSTQVTVKTTAPNNEVSPTTPFTHGQLTHKTTTPNTGVIPKTTTPSTQLTPKTTAPSSTQHPTSTLETTVPSTEVTTATPVQPTHFTPKTPAPPANSALMRSVLSIQLDPKIPITYNQLVPKQQGLPTGTTSKKLEESIHVDTNIPTDTLEDPSNNITPKSFRRGMCQRTSMGIKLPRKWSPMESEDQMKIEILIPSSDEYQRVKRQFIRKGGSRNIKEIQRLQCPGTYQLYRVKRREVQKSISDSSKFKVEKTLYHGTSHDVLKNILLSGFNRSLCGKNATAFGQGTYFAKNASLSCLGLYARPDADGYQHVLQCRVVTGEYTLGKAPYKSPPEKPNSDTNFHSVVDDTEDPTMFVIFHDAQAYAEYLIKFKP